MKKAMAVVAAFLMLSLSACGAAIEQQPVQPTSTTSVSKTEAVTTSSAPDETASEADSLPTDMESEVPYRPISMPKISLTNSNTLIFEGKLENIDHIKIYCYSATSDNSAEVTQELIFDGTTADIFWGELSFDTQNILHTEVIPKDNSAIMTDFSARAIKVCAYNDGCEEWTEPLWLEAYLDTGVTNQYDCTFHGSSACGAANGALLLQTVDKVQEDELTARSTAIRDYSALGYEYSGMASIGYRMTGPMVVNSVNDFLADNGIEHIKLDDLDDADTPLEELIIGAINTGRPAAVIVSYFNNGIISDFKNIGHWITINGYRIDEEGQLQFRWENTLNKQQSWLDSESLTNSVQAFIDGTTGDGASERTLFTLSDGTDIKVTRHVIALSEPVVDSLI